MQTRSKIFTMLTVFDKAIQFSFKAAFPKHAALSRGDVTDAQWRILDRLLPDRGERVIAQGPTSIQGGLQAGFARSKHDVAAAA